MTSRRKLLQAGAGLIGSAMLTAAAPAAALGPKMSGRKPSLTGPIRGGRHGRPFCAYFGDIGAIGYVEEEYFVSGEAQRYEPVGPLSADGRWTFKPVGTAPFKTRVLVRRPRDRARFNGTVVVEWTNVSAGFEIANADSNSVYDGMAHVAISAQQVGLHGFPGDKARGLRQWDAERYGSLSHPGDSYSYDIFSQVARLFGAKRSPAKVDPLGGLRVEKLIAVGASQSGLCLTGYFNAVQPRDQIFDGFLLLITPGGASGYDDRIFNPPDPEMMARFNTPIRTRDDLPTPVMVVNSEAEALRYLGARQPDSPKFRLWEIAGASHAPTGTLKSFDEKNLRDGYPTFVNPRHHTSDVMWRPSYDAALVHVHRWLRGGPPPPSQPRIHVVACEKPYIERDVYGNATGGVRLPELVAPIAHYQGSDQRPGGGSSSGFTEPFPIGVLQALYPTHDVYVAQVEAAARAAEAAGVILPYQTQAYIEQAKATQFG